MAHRGTLGAWGALVLALVASMGCEGEREKFPPPQPYPGNPGGTGDPAGGTGGVGAAGGAGGAGASGTTSSTGTGNPAVANLCECTFGMVDSAACGSCVNDAVAPGKQCEDADVACKSSQECDSLFKCKLACVGKPEAEKVTCIQDCYSKVDLSSPDNHDFVNLTDCLCNKCAITCAPSMAITCE